jgi:cell division protein FtsW
MTTLKESIKPRFRAQSREFYMLLGLTAVITLLGLAMVASASSVDAFKSTANAADTVIRQGGFALIGAVALVVASNLPLAIYKRFALLFLWGTLGLQLLTVLFGNEINGNRNWLDLGFTSIQPSEFLKLGLVIAFSLMLSELTGDELYDQQIWKRVFVYSAAALVMVVYFGKDMGTGVVMVITLAGLFLFAGMKLRSWLGLMGLVAFGAFALVMMSGSRRARFAAWLNPTEADPMGVNWQFEKGTWALAQGGIFGSGLGRSRMKWSWIPEVQNDFIFAIIGEELGLIGALFVILLFCALAVTMFMIAKNQTNAFSRNIVATVMVWISMQAFINIGVVLGLFPVLGVPLPLISAGGSSLIITLASIGVVLAVERDRVKNLGRSRR